MIVECPACFSDHVNLIQDDSPEFECNECGEIFIDERLEEQLDFDDDSDD